MRNVAQALIAFTIIGTLLSFLAARPVYAMGAGAVPRALLQPEEPAGPLQISLTVDPPAGQIGAIFTATLLLNNSGDDVSTPEVSLSAPLDAEFDTTSLPAGTVVDLQSDSISWFPVLPAGENRTFTITFQMDATDLDQPTQSVTATILSDGRQEIVSADFWIGVPPVAEIALTPTRAAVGQPIQLLANIDGPGPLRQTWQLGDGRTLEANDPQVVYPAAGTYPITLIVANPLGSTRATSQVVVVPETIAGFTVEDNTPGPDQPVRFLNQSGGQPPLSYRWDFGDGTQSTDQNPTHQYASPGQYQVTLVTSNTFGTATSTRSLFVGGAPQLNVQAPDTTTTGTAVVGQAAGDETIRAFTWDMGDGAFYEGPIVNHTFSAVGEYVITVTAENDYAATAVTRTITVSPPAWQIFLPAIRSGAPLPTTPPAANARVVPERLSPLSENATPAEQLLWFINEARRIHNLPPVSYSYELSIAAQQHATDMANSGFTGHVGSDGSRPPERLAQSGYAGSYAGEATAWGYNDPVPVVEFWVNSPGHRVIILNPDATEVGLGFAVNFSASSVWYWTVEFGVNRPSRPE